MTITVARAFSRRHRAEPAYDVEINWPDNKQLIGIEIEAEGRFAGGDKHTVFPPANSLSFWHVANDGSLVNGREFKLMQPLSGSRLAAAIYELFREGTTFHRSVSSGTHIHINMDEETTPLGAVQSLVALVYAIEPAIYNMTDPGRRWGGFTNPLDSANNQLFDAVLRDTLTEDFSPLVSLCSSNHTYKYLGLNVQTLGSYGSVEFRYFPTATNMQEVVDWVSLVQSIKLAAVATPNLAGMVETLKNEDSYVSMVSAFLGPWAERILSYVPPAMARKRVIQMMAKYTAGRIFPENMPLPQVSLEGKYRKFFRNLPREDELADEDYALDAPENANELGHSALVVDRRTNTYLYHVSERSQANLDEMREGSVVIYGRADTLLILSVVVSTLSGERRLVEFARCNTGAHVMSSRDYMPLLAREELDNNYTSIARVLLMACVHPRLAAAGRMLESIANNVLRAGDTARAGRVRTPNP